jgi:hypothetical protein
MEIKDLFKKDINRDIEGVVMIGNETESRKVQELDEYVCTREIVDNFRLFFSAYRKSIQSPTDKIGVWITGFFGSGKSHFLKILGYVLSNEAVGGKNAIDYFDGKITDPMIKADMKASASQENLVILFNIDSKAKSDAKNRNQSIMETMLNCFNEKIGLCGSIPWLAQLERGLMKDGLYDKFVKHFTEVSGKDYIEKRKDIFFLRDKFIQTLSDIKGISLDSSKAFFDDAQKNYSPTIEEFAKIIADYCSTTGKRVVFLMDEVGQFIGTNSEMMLGLQTVVEDLGKYAGGKAWVVVTSQQQIDALVEGTNKAAQLDFSKIQGRFATRLTMSSSNADEVIKKRLLDKTDDAKNLLGVLYDEKADKLNNLLMFPANPKWTGYKDKTQFIDDYPYVNYQYELLQFVFDSIRENGMSEGKSISSGERSLLSAFKDSCVAKCQQNVGILIPFNDFYKTAEEFMDWNIKQVFSNAKKRMANPFDIDVLEVLFMLKGVKEMEPTIERIATLMVTSIDDDKVDLKKKIKESLDRLMAETFVQQNGDRYEFLTNEEQDVNRKIKNSQYSQQDVYNKIRDLVYDSVVGCSKTFPYKGKYTFGLNRYIDDNLSGSDNPDYISVKIYTPWDSKDMSYEQRSAQSDGCLVIDLSNGSYLDELIQLSKIQTFDRNNASTGSSKLQEILQRKRIEANEREKRAEKNLFDCMAGAAFYQNGTVLDISTKDPKKRFEDGVERAILNKYHKLNYVVEFTNKAEDIAVALRDKQSSLTSILDGNEGNANALRDIMSFIKNERAWKRQISMNALISKFQKPPYGYRANDIRLMVAQLLANNYIKAKEHGIVQNCSDQNFVWDLSRGNNDQYISLETQEKADPAVLMKVKTIMKNAFDRTIELKESTLRDESLSFFKNKLEDLKKIAYGQQGEYPGKELVGDMINVFSSITVSDDPESVFKKIVDSEESLNRFGETMDSVINFYKQNSSQMRIWQSANQLVEFHDTNAVLIPEVSEMDEVVEKMGKILGEDFPFSDIPALGNLVGEANAIKLSITDARKKKAEEGIEEAFERIKKEKDEALKRDFNKPDTSKSIMERYSAELQLEKQLIESLGEDAKIDTAASRAAQELNMFRSFLQKALAEDTAKADGAAPVQKKKVSVVAKELIPVANKTITTQAEIDDLVNSIHEYLNKLLKDHDEIDID